MYYAGIDLGGTKIYALITDGTGKIFGQAKLKTEKAGGINRGLEMITECYLLALKEAGLSESKISAIGLAMPSSVNIKKGLLLYAPNLGWKNAPLSQSFANKVKKPVFMDNDGNMGVYAEYTLGETAKFSNVYGIFVGTGVGGGYISGGQLVRGLNYTAGEIGHMVVKIGGPKCGCGRKGCLEAIAGKTGIVKYMKKLVEEKGEKTILDDMNPDWKNGVGAGTLLKAYKKNDKVVIRAVSRASKALGVACANLVNALGLEAVILGGGVIEEMASDLVPVIKEYMVRYSISDGAKGVMLSVSKLGDDAVALGAAIFASKRENREMLFYPQKNK